MHIIQFVIFTNLFIQSSVIAGTTMFNRLEVNDQLPQGAVSEVFLDDEGFLWIRSEDEIFRFDGYTLHHLSAGAGFGGTPGQGLSNRIAQDLRGTIWLAAGGSRLSYYDPSSRSLVSFPKALGPKGSRSPISTIFSNKRGILWIGHQDGSISRLDTHKREFLYEISLNESSVSADPIVDFDAGNSGAVWVVTRFGQILKCYEHLDHCESFHLSDYVGTQLEIKVASLTAAWGNRLVIGGNRGLFELNLDDGKAKIHSFSKDKTKISSRLAIKQTAMLNDRELWVATEGGLVALHADGNFNVYDRENSVLGSNHILSLKPDRNSGMFVGTWRGVYLTSATEFTTFTSRDSEFDNSITSIANSEAHGTLVGTYNGLFNLKEQPKDPLREKAYSPIELPDPRVMAMDLWGDQLWVGMRERGIQIVDLSTGKSTSHFDPESGIEAVADFARYSDGTTAVATFGGGVHILSATGELLESFRANSDNSSVLSSDWTVCIERLSSSELLVGTISGIDLITTDGNLSSYDRRTDADHIDSFYTSTILEGENRDVWIGTESKGLVRWRAADRDNKIMRFSAFVTNPRLPSETVYALEEDELGMIWASTTNGLVRINPKTGSLIKYTKSDGLQGNEFNSRASYKDSKGVLYFGGVHGFSRFHPEDLNLKTKAPLLRLIDVSMAGRRVDKDPIIVSSIGLNLSHALHSLELEFSTLDYIAPGDSRYKYQLQNFDKDWVDIGTRNTVSLSNLPSGEYMLRVIGANSDGVWNMEGIHLPIIVQPAPWLSWWAFAIYGAIALCIALFIKKYYDTYRLKEIATQRAFVMHDTAERAMDNLHDQLLVEQRLVGNVRRHNESIIQMIVELLEEQAQDIQDELVLETFGENQRRMRCLRMLQSYLYFRADTLEVGFHRWVNATFKELLRGANTSTLEIVPLNETLEITLPAWMIVPAAMITQELISNSAKHAFAGLEGVQTITVYLRENPEGTHWVLEVSDSGVGLPESISPERATTMGMDFVRRCAESLDATTEISRVKGTKFRFEIPRRKPHSAS